MTARQRTATLVISTLLTSAVFAFSGDPQAPPPGTAPNAPAAVPSLIRNSPLLIVIDVDHDGVLSAAEMADAPARLKTLDKNGDGKLTRDEAALPAGFGRPAREGRGPEEARQPPIAGPAADELLASLMAYDKNKDGKLAKTEVPARLQGMFERADTNKDGVLDAAELHTLAADQAAAPPAPPGRRGGGRGGFGQLDLASIALDLNHDGEIGADEIAAAATSLKTLDTNGDGQITDDEVRPTPGQGRAGADGAGR